MNPALNTTSTITWSTTNATSCTASGGTAGWIANGSTTGGSWTTGALTAGPHTYSLDCSGPGGPGSGNVTVNTATFNCGDGACQLGENIVSCPVDCKSTVKQF
jgi:hypothetical protein